MAKFETGVYLVLGEVNLLLTAIRRNNRWTSNNYHSENENELITNMVYLKNLLNEITDLKSISSTDYLLPFLAIIRSEETTGPITGLALTSINKFLSYRLIEKDTEQSVSAAVEQIADAVTHARFVGTDPNSDEVILLKILYVLRSLMLCSSGVYLTNESVCEIIRSCFRICFEMRLSELLRKSAEHTLVDMVQLLFGRLSEFKDDPRHSPLRKLKMRTGSGLGDSSKSSRLRKKSPKVKVKTLGRHDNRPHVSKETINMQDPSSFNQQLPSSSHQGHHHANKGNNSSNNNNENNTNNTNDNDAKLKEEHRGNNNNRDNDDNDKHSSSNDNKDNTIEVVGDIKNANEFDAANNNENNNIECNLGNDPNNNNIKCNLRNDPNINIHSSIPANHSSNHPSNIHSNEDPSMYELSNDDPSNDRRIRGVHVPDSLSLPSQDVSQPGVTPDSSKENYVWVDDLCPAFTPLTTSPSEPPIDHILVGVSEDRGKEVGEGVKEDDGFVNRRGVHFTSLEECTESHPATSHHQDESIASGPYSIPCIRELFRFLISLTNPHDKDNSEIMIHMGLSLLTVSLESGADHIGQSKSLLPLVKDDMCKHLFFLLKYERLSLYAASIRVCFLLFESMRGHLKLQMEMYIIKLMELVVSESVRVTLEQKEIALESVMQLLRVPGLVSELYLNYDCNLYSSNLFEDLAKLLSKNAFPVSGIVSTNLLSLYALLAIIDTIVGNCQHRIVHDTSLNESKNADDTKRCEFGSMDNLPRIKNTSSPSAAAMVISQAAEGMRSPSMTSGRSGRMRQNRMKVTKETPSCDELAAVKHNKKVYQAGTEQFNQKPSEGVSFLQKNGLLSSQLDPEEVANFIKQSPKLDKKQIGEFISSRKNNNILEAYQKSFNFEGTRIDEALRMYLETFRLPGEAPVISYLLEHFAEHWHKLNGEPFENADAAFTLSYAVIMLNVDQHNSNAKKQNVPMTCESFKKNLSKVNGGRDFEGEMLEEMYQCIKTDEIVMPAEQVGLVRDNYLWKVLLRHSHDSEYQHVSTGTYDRDLFSIVWGPTVAALSFVFDRSSDNSIVQKAVNGFRKCAMISAHYEMSDVFDNLVISLCKFTTLLTIPETSDSLAISFGNNQKAQLAARTVFALAHRHSDILHDGWRNILDCIMQLFKANLLSEVLVKVEDFLDPSGRISLIREEQSTQNKVDTGMFSNLYTFFSMSDSPNVKIPPQEDQEATKRAQDCILECHVEQLIMESKFLKEDSLQELLKALIYDTRCNDSLEDSRLGNSHHDESHVLRLELLFKVALQNRDRILTYWAGIEEHLYNTIAGPAECSFLLERAVVGLLRLACRLLRREELSHKLLNSLRILLVMKSTVLHNHLICRHVSYGVHDLLKTNASNIHTPRDWKVIFTIICVAGASLMTSPSLFNHLQCHHSPFHAPTLDLEAQSDSELSRASRTSKDRGYTSDCEIYEGMKALTISSSSSFQALPTSSQPSLIPPNLSSNPLSNTTTPPTNLPHPNPPFATHAPTNAPNTSDLSPLQAIPTSSIPSDEQVDDGLSHDTRAKKKSKTLLAADGSWFAIYQNCVSSGKEGPRSKHSSGLDHTYNITLNHENLTKHDFKAFSKCCETLSFLVRDAAQMTPHNFPACIHAIRVFVEASVDGAVSHRLSQTRKTHHLKTKSKGKKDTMMRKSRSSPSHLVVSKEASRHSDDDDDENSDAYQTISIQLLDLMHTLHTRAATIFNSWAEKRTSTVVDECEVSLWSSCWCPLLQGIARLCCDSRKQVRNQALTYLQRALLVHDLQVLSASEWEDCFSRVLFPLLSLLLQSFNPWDKSGAEETRMRASALLCKVFLQHLTPLLNLPTFTALWLTILDFMDKYMHVDLSDLLLEAIPESLKNMLLVMQTAGILKEEEGSGELWCLTWDRINLFLPHLKKEVFKPHETGAESSSCPSPNKEATASATQEPLQSVEQQQPQKLPESPQQPSPQQSSPTLQQPQQPSPTLQQPSQPPQLSQSQEGTTSETASRQQKPFQPPSPLSQSILDNEATKATDLMSSIPPPTSHYIFHPPLASVTDYQPGQDLPLIINQESLNTDALVPSNNTPDAQVDMQNSGQT